MRGKQLFSDRLEHGENEAIRLPTVKSVDRFGWPTWLAMLFSPVMVIHLVFFKLLPEAGGKTAAENQAEMIRRLQELPAKIPELQSLSAGADFSRTPASFDVGLYTAFADEAAMETYRVHPAHQEVVAFIKEVTSDRAVVDYVV